MLWQDKITDGGIVVLVFFNEKSRINTVVQEHLDRRILVLMMKPLRKLIVLIVLLYLSACSQQVSSTKEPTLDEQTVDESLPTVLPTENSTELHPISTALPTPTIDATPLGTSQQTPTENVDRLLNPLTGLPVSDPEVLQRHPVMVKLANWPREERPQAGLSQADMVFEYYIGHQMNQFLALYYGEDVEAVGPVRSGRLVDAQLGNFYQGFLVYANAELAAEEILIKDLGDRALKFGDLPCPPLCGGTNTSSGDAFVDTAALTSYLRENGLESDPPDLTGMTFQADPPTGDGPGHTLQVTYADFSIMQWRYDEESQSYALWMESEGADGLTLAPLTDRSNDQGIRFDNIVVLYATYKSYTDSLHDVLLTDQEGYQAMMLFRDGRASFGSWHTPEANKPIVFETPEGEVLPLKPGRTWIVIVGQSSITNDIGSGEWEIEFRN